MLGVTRGLATLIGIGVAGFLLWVATQMGTDGAGEYWATYGIVAAAGLTLALSQIVGGWTKWGWPRVSGSVFLLGFLPALVVGGWILLAHEPAQFMNTSNWSADLGIAGFVDDMGVMLPAVALIVGLAFGLTFDTAGPRRHTVVTPVPAPMEAPERPAIVHDGRDAPSEVTGDVRSADEPLTAERESVERQPGQREPGRRPVGSGTDTRDDL
jgi:hypothetical protein